MSFLYSFLNFLQPGILWPEIADLRPMLVISIVALLVGVSRRAVYPRREAFVHPVFMWLTAFIFAQILSVYYGGLGAMLDEVSFWNVYLIFSVVSLLLISDLSALKRYVLGMIVGGMFVVGYGIYAVWAQVGFGVTGRAGAYGMYENHNDYTFIIIQILPFIYLYMRAETGLIRRGLLALSLFTCVIGVFLSLSRGGILALLLEFALIIVFTMQGKRRMVFLPVFALVGAIAVGYQWAKRDENSTTYTAADAESSRFELWRAARKMFQDKPLLGVGSRRFYEYSARYEEISHDEMGKNSHNTYLEILTGTGLIGFIPFVMMSWRLIKEMRRRPASPGPPLLDATQMATLIAFYTILFRALLDAKTYDWSFYMLCTIGIACVMLRRQFDKPVGMRNGVSAAMELQRN